MTRRTDFAARARVLVLVTMSATGAAQAQAPAASVPGGSSVPSAQSSAPFDPTGDWVSLVTRDWRFRMVVPGRGEYQGVPLSLAGKQFADAWDPARDEAAGKQCAAYGGGVVMLVPERLQIGWKDDATLQVRTDAGKQTRLLHFQPTAEPAAASASLQGDSQAQWLMHHVVTVYFNSKEPADAPKFGSLKIITTHLSQGLIRKNGVAYSDQSKLTEYWELQRDPDTQARYLIVTARLEDPVYLTRGYFYIATFQKEADNSKWNPTPCTLTAQP